MAKAKKIQRYVANTPIPDRRKYYKALEKVEAYNDFWNVYNIYKTIPQNDYYTGYYNLYVDGFNNGTMDVTKWKEHLGEWRSRMMLNSIYPHTPESRATDEALLAEFDAREDLREVYEESFNENWCVYDRFENRIEKTQAVSQGYNKRPDSAGMYHGLVKGSNTAAKKAELARETPYQEGDLVLFRKPFIGTKHDPLYVYPYSQEYRDGARTPDDSVMRIGTVYGVTERVSGYYATKGSKVIQLQWVGKEDLEDVEEKYIKWHMRPTYKNGLKVRE